MQASDTRTTFVSRIPVSIDCPQRMRDAVRYVLEGEYDCDLDGRDLSILDIGANVGSFARWADLRWPHSLIHCFEPNPGTFAILQRNIAGFRNIMATNAAVYPGVGATAPFFARYDGDGEAGLVSYATDTFREGAVSATCEVAVVVPGSLPSCDIVKLDVEGGEAAILDHLDLSSTELVLVEFQNRRNREAIRARLDKDFVVLLDEESPWDPILDYRDYRPDLAGDIFGRLFYCRRETKRLQRRVNPSRG